jgi:UDP-glucuronate 4-epimerase
MMAHSYSHLFGIPATGLRFFTVYGPWGRPDMALFKFVRAMLAGEAIQVFNKGEMERDFTYIDDIVGGTLGALDRIPEADPGWRAEEPDPASSGIAPYRIYNIGNNTPIRLTRYIEILEECLGVEAKKELLPLQPGDVIASWADVGDIARDMGYHPATPVEVGVPRFVEWYKEFYG